MYQRRISPLVWSVLVWHSARVSRVQSEMAVHHRRLLRIPEHVRRLQQSNYYYYYYYYYT